jgi:hypothetical protein
LQNSSQIPVFYGFSRLTPTGAMSSIRALEGDRS